MRTLGAVTAAAALALALSSSAAQAGKSGRQSVEGSFVTPGNAADDTCFAGLTRRLATLSGDQINGVTGYHFDVDPATENRPFRLTPLTGQGHLDLDIVYYDDWSDPMSAIDPTTPPRSFGFRTRDTNGEKGRVPIGMTKAIVCLYLDPLQQPPMGALATFKYVAGK